MSQRAKRAVEEPHHLATPTRSPTRSRFITSSLRYSFTSRRLCSCLQRRGRACSQARGTWVNSWRRPIYFLPFSLLLNRILFASISSFCTSRRAWREKSMRGKVSEVAGNQQKQIKGSLTLTETGELEGGTEEQWSASRLFFLSPCRTCSLIRLCNLW